MSNIDHAFARWIVRGLVPPAARKKWRAMLGRWVLDWEFQRFTRDPYQALKPSSKSLGKLRFGWGNEGFSASEEYLAACLKHALNSEGPILECGSGLSTMLVAVVAQMTRRHLVVLEHSEQWATKMREGLAKYGLSETVVLHCALKDYGAYQWYDVGHNVLPHGIKLCICDGPPGSTRGGRYGLMPQVAHKLEPGCVVLLDDTCRAEELEIARRWAIEFDASVRQQDSEATFLELTIK